ncbi:MAG: translation initiation factor IF-2 [Patescibacteria group bacterium]|nr:translation initiation factor IF-2 [Patescibacteria group bacterium]
MDEKKYSKENLKSKPPVVVVLGHVDHGKSSLLEAVKDFNILKKESGGITQHIGAYEVEKDNKKITFIDTPGHSAFFAMRSRGAKVADIAVLVVAADEGVKTQTKEAMSHIKKAGISMLVAINKMDKPEADPEKVKRELSENGVILESMGGKIPSVNVSAKTGKGIEDLLELILLLAEMQSLKTTLEDVACGVAIEAYLDAQRGATATLLIRDGILKLGDIVGTSTTFGRVKILENFQGKSIKEAFPSMPVVIIGFENVPRVGEKFKVYPSIESARNSIKENKRKIENKEVFVINPDQKVLNLILKADVVGSLEAIENIFKDIPQEKVVLRILKRGVGEISDSDLKLAQSAKKTKILGFRVKTSPQAVKLALRESMKIMNFDVIYDLVQWVRSMMEKLVESEIIRTDIGKLKVLEIFHSEKDRQVVGGKVVEGDVKKGTKIEIFRDEEAIGIGNLINLQKNKKDADAVGKGEECGLLYKGDTKIEEGDILVFYQEIKNKEI